MDRYIEVLDLGQLGFTRTVPSEVGRPCHLAQALCKLYVYGYENGIRSSRKLEREGRQTKQKRSLTPPPQGSWATIGAAWTWRTTSKVPDSKDQPEELHSDKFVYDESADTYTCPMGQTLYPHNKKTAKRHNYFNKTACASCPQRDHCAKGQRPYRTVTRSQYSEIYAEADRTFAENLATYKRRQQMVEHHFGTVKHAMGGGYFLLRTRRKVRSEIVLLFLGYNLKRAVKVLGFQGIMARLEAISHRLFHMLRVWGERPLICRISPVAPHKRERRVGIL